MKVSYQWLKDFVKIDQKPDELAELLTLSGTEVEKITKEADDYIFDLDITPNRGDELSVLGVAREVSALTKKKLTLPITKIVEKSNNLPLTIEIMDELACPRFTYRFISGITIKPSPQWIVKRLKSYGFRAINNIVDITNLVMIELGQPLHAFDYDKIKGHKILIRRAKDGERVKTLDGIERILDEDAVIIEDDENLIDLAGIMGGELSEIGKNSQTIILQAAIFNPVLIRKTSKEQALVTDASYRFERGIDQAGQILALNRATELILKYAGSQAGSIIDLQKLRYEPKTIEVNLKKVSSLLGIKIKEKEAVGYLKSLGFEVILKNEKLTVAAPSWRNDLSLWQDVAEEIIRIKGYDKIKLEPLERLKPKNTNSSFKQKEILKDRFNNLGLSEIYSYDFLSTKDLEHLQKTDQSLFEIENPVAPENRYLRDSLLPSLLKTIAKNPTFSEIKIFEIGEVFDLKNGERNFIGIGLAVDKIEKITEIIDKINQSTLSDLKWQTKTLTTDELRRYKIKKKFAAIAEADLSQFLRDKPLQGEFQLIKDLKYRAISKYPSIARDFAFIIENDVSAQLLVEEFKKVSSLVVRAELFDEFESAKFGKNKKSLAFHLEFQAGDRTLTKKEGDELSKKIITLVEKKYQGKLRDK